jgi:DNA-binding response OmpR family regulator
MWHVFRWVAGVQVSALPEKFLSAPDSPEQFLDTWKGAGHRISVLLIESDGPVRRDLAGALELAGCSVVADAALPADPSRIGLVDVALVDVGNGADGWGRVTTLRRIIPGLDVVVMSVDRGDRDRGQAMGFTSFIEKPFGLGELLEVLRSVVGVRTRSPAV